jgi:hypothetical protein
VLQLLLLPGVDDDPLPANPLMDDDRLLLFRHQLDDKSVFDPFKKKKKIKEPNVNNR